jgi:hypothetical protein
LELRVRANQGETETDDASGVAIGAIWLEYAPN